jgi:hypothetical protein
LQWYWEETKKMWKTGKEKLVSMEQCQDIFETNLWKNDNLNLHPLKKKNTNIGHHVCVHE